MEELLKLNVCVVDKPSQLHFLYDKISVNIRGLEALGVKSEQYGSLLIPIIMAKLPDEIRIQVTRNTAQDVWEIDSLLGLIQSENDAREMSEKIKAATVQAELIEGNGYEGRQTSKVLNNRRSYNLKVPIT